MIWARTSFVLNSGQFLAHALPLPYGGKVRQVMVDVDSHQLVSKGLSPMDVVNAVNAH